MSHSFLHTFTFDQNESDLMWSFASLLHPGLSGDIVDKLQTREAWKIERVSALAAPLCVFALLRQTSVPQLVNELNQSSFDWLIKNGDARSPFRREVLFAEEIVRRSLVPLSAERSYRFSETSLAQKSVALVSLADLLSESSSLPVWQGDEPHEKNHLVSTTLYWVSHQDQSFLLLNHPRALVVGGRFEPHQLLSIWKTFIEWLFN